MAGMSSRSRENQSPRVGDPGCNAMSQRSGLCDEEAGAKELVGCDVVAEVAVDEQIGSAAAQHLAPPGIDGPQDRTVPVGEN